MLTIAICTHNRSGDVARCLAELMPQIKSNSRVVVVDSDSAVEHALSLEDQVRQRGIRYLRVDQPGLSLARNAAAAQAEGEWIVYLDDDAIPAPDWLASLCRVLATLDAGVGVIGGRVTPGWPAGERHDQVTERWKLLLSCVELQGHGRVRDGFNICGANLAVRRSALELANGFPTNLGRIGNNLLSGEESYLIELLAQRGVTAAYDSRFAVVHCIAHDRLKLSWAVRRAYWEGVSRVHLHRLLDKPIPKSQNIPKLAASIAILTLLAALSHNPDWRIRRAMALGSLRAQLGRV